MAVVDTERILGEIRGYVARMEQVPPSPPASHNAWFCNGCTFETYETERAIDHALENAEPFPHVLYEREKRDGRTVRRIHSEPGPSEAVPVIARVMQPRRG